MNGSPQAIRCDECRLLVPNAVHLGNLTAASPGPHKAESDGKGFATKGSPPCPGQDKLGEVVRFDPQTK